MGKVLGIVYRTLATHLIHQAGYIKATANTGAVTLIQCFGSALNVNVHFHMLFLDTLERLCRYITRPALSEKRLSLTENRQIRYEL